MEVMELILNLIFELKLALSYNESSFLHLISALLDDEVIIINMVKCWSFAQIQVS